MTHPIVRALTGLPRMVSSVLNHPANDQQRTAGLVRATRHFVLTRVLDKPTTTPLGSSSRIHVQPDRPASSRVVIGNPPDPHEMRVLQRLLGPGSIFVDVGANIGVYSIFAADLGATVIALEPGSVDALHGNIALNNMEGQVDVHNVAAADRAGEMQFTSGLDQGDSFVSPGSAPNSSPDGRDATLVTVHAVTVDSMVEHESVAVVKIDVEGFERLVVEGMASILAEQRVEAVQLEWNRACEAALGESRVPTAQALVDFGYVLAVPDAEGNLAPCSGDYNQDESIDIFALRPDVAQRMIST